MTASQDAEILRLRGALEEIANLDTQVHEGGIIYDAAGGQMDVVETEEVAGPFAKIARAALSSPAPQDAVIVPRNKLRVLAIVRHERPAYGGGYSHNGYSCKLCKSQIGPHEQYDGDWHEPDCLLGAPTRG